MARPMNAPPLPNMLPTRIRSPPMPASRTVVFRLFIMAETTVSGTPKGRLSGSCALGDSCSVVVAAVHVDARDAGAVEHVDVAAVVLHRELGLEARGPEVADHAPLVLAGPVPVAGAAHDQQVPPEV